MRFVRGFHCAAIGLGGMLFAAVASHAAPPAAVGYTKMIFGDEFSSLSLDTAANGSATWDPEAGSFCQEGFVVYKGYIGNGTMPIDLDIHQITPQGTLKLLAYATPSRNLKTVNYGPFISSSMSTKRTHLFCQGYFEIRGRFGLQEGMHGCIWLASAKYGNELDIVEVFGEERHLCGDLSMYDALTSNAFPVDGNWEGSGALMHGVDLNQWHTYGFLRDLDSLHWYLDDSCYHQRAAGASFPPDDSMYLVLNLMVGGNAFPDSTVNWPMVQEIDYWRVYQKP
jgi:beta-glucanase (GH16 family)